WEIFWWALEGARVCLLAPGGEKDPQQIVEAIKQNQVTVMHFVPSMLRAFLEYIKEPLNATGLTDREKISALRQVFASGEALELSLVKEFNRLLYNPNKTALANLYGPTEAAIDVSYYDCPVEGNIQRIPIGKPIENITLYVLGNNDLLQPVGAPGELCIAGVGLARGYLNKPELTAERFPKVSRQLLSPSFPKNQSLITNNHLYRTGDLARWLPDGNIEYLGRIDNQVKIRGFRIELEEIETVLERHDGIKQAVVAPLTTKSGTKNLCAYIVWHKKETKIAALREHTGKHLPEYMVPSYFVKLEKIPISPNGKIDRKALPQPRTEDTGSDETRYRDPQNDLQEHMAQVWKEVLGRRRIGIDDNFITIGGDSIQAIQIASKLNRVGYKLEIAHIFKHLTIDKISRC
ncbi:MAG: non-ribosomal peptide synthetase, partial [bacterium]|nr:non-ribosomal peptide synthetase [bacterium]